MKKINIGTLILLICNSHLISAGPKVDSTDLSNVRGKRDLQYGQSVGNYYSNFNQADNVITTALPSQDSDGTANVANGADADSLLSHSLDDGSNYFRNAMDNRIIARSVYDPTGNAEDEFVPFDKQSPGNLMDVRGKNFISFYPLRLAPKRAPSGFVGLRGKKYYDGTKRVPSGFTGMRGKKSDYEMDNNIDVNYAESEPTDDVDFFELLQKERKLLDDINEIYQMDHDMRNDPSIFVEDAFRAAEKRVPSGFVGMRGKKAAYFKDGYFGAKRAPSGFLGVRGKREDAIDYSEGSKRGPFLGYLGTRGKKEPTMSERILHRNELNGLNWPVTDLLMELSRTPPKRVPSGFMGVRGKKMSDENFAE